MDKLKLEAFFSELAQYPRVVVQTHDFPDHDAVSSAYAFVYLLAQYGVKAQIAYNGDIERISLHNLIRLFDIPIHFHEALSLTEQDKIITIDSCTGEKNIRDLPGDEIAVIDHHQVQPSAEVLADLIFCDIRPEYGATATIIYEYYQLLGVPMPQDIASALLVGLNVDTSNLTRGVIQADLEAFVAFNQIADVRQVNSILSNSLVMDDLPNFYEAIENHRAYEDAAVVLLKHDCTPSMMGIIADFLLSVDEFNVVIVGAQQKAGMRLSLRSENEQVDVGILARKVLNNQQYGFGGGHSYMAGGLVKSEHCHHFLDDNCLFSPFIQELTSIYRQIK